MRFYDLFGADKPIIGVIHLPALPGHPDSPGLDRVIGKALKDLNALEASGARHVAS